MGVLLPVEFYLDQVATTNIGEKPPHTSSSGTVKGTILKYTRALKKA